jgi:hypothetical protein
VLVQQVDRLDVQTLEAGLDNLPDMVGLAVDSGAAFARNGVDIESELGDDDYLVSNGREPSPTSTSLVQGP